MGITGVSVLPQTPAFKFKFLGFLQKLQKDIHLHLREIKGD